MDIIHERKLKARNCVVLLTPGFMTIGHFITMFSSSVESGDRQTQLAHRVPKDEWSFTKSFKYLFCEWNNTWSQRDMANPLEQTRHWQTLKVNSSLQIKGKYWHREAISKTLEQSWVWSMEAEGGGRMLSLWSPKKMSERRDKLEE
jgi:hypothetical protein